MPNLYWLFSYYNSSIQKGDRSWWLNAQPLKPDLSKFKSKTCCILATLLWANCLNSLLFSIVLSRNNNSYWLKNKLEHGKQLKLCLEKSKCWVLAVSIILFLCSDNCKCAVSWLFCIKSFFFALSSFTLAS